MPKKQKPFLKIHTMYFYIPGYSFSKKQQEIEENMW